MGGGWGFRFLHHIAPPPRDRPARGFKLIMKNISNFGIWFWDDFQDYFGDELDMQKKSFWLRDFELGNFGWIILSVLLLYLLEWEGIVDYGYVA